MWVELPAAEACAADVGSATSQGCEQLTVEARFLADEVEGVGATARCSVDRVAVAWGSMDTCTTGRASCVAQYSAAIGNGTR